MGKKINIVGMRFGSLVVLAEAGLNKHREVLWQCQCSCGNIAIVRGGRLRSGETKSCGCMKGNRSHGKTKSAEYQIWSRMIQRCTNPKTRAYRWYGGRGISVCAWWLKFENFYQDMGKRPSSKHTIERIDGNADYLPKNCKWATMTEQAHNRKIHKDNKTGTPGVRWCNRNKKYQAYIGVNSKQVHLGFFTQIQDAIDARKDAEKKYWGK